MFYFLTMHGVPHLHVWRGLLNFHVHLQIFLARGLQLEKTSKVANVQYIAVRLFCHFIENYNLIISNVYI